MSLVSHEAAPSTDEPLANLLFEYPGADIILCSHDNYHFRLPKVPIVNISTVLGEVIRRALDLSGDANPETSLPVVHLLDSGEILHCLLTFIFLVTPLLPSTPEGIMELLSTAQKYQMGDVLTHIRGSIARQNSLPTALEPALHIYALAQDYSLRPEALQSARSILKYPMTIEDFENKLDIMSGASFYELWKYHKRVRSILASDLTEFRMSCAHGTLMGLNCEQYSPHNIPHWFDQYIESVGEAPNLFDLIEFNTAMARHLGNGGLSCHCATIPSQTIRNFWDALTSVVHGGFEKARADDLLNILWCRTFIQAESALSLVRELPEREDPQINSAASPSQPFDVPEASLILRSSDVVDFRVHKPLLAMASPFFKDLLSLPQPSDSETVDGLPMVQLSESSELLNSLVSILYPVPTVVPDSYEKLLYLLAACQKYEMVSVQSSIRAEVSRQASLVPKGAEAFTAYAIASAKELIPEMENAARLTMDHPMTFDNLGEGLRLFEGWALRDLVNLRRRCRDSLVSCLDSFLDVKPSGPSNVWVGCPDVMPPNPFHYQQNQQNRLLPRWLNQCISRSQNELKLQKVDRPLDIHLRIRRECFTAFQVHATCRFCMGVHMKDGPTFYAEFENRLVQARNKVRGDHESQLGLT